MENNDLKYLKKHYGEKFVYFCRSNFPTALEVEGLLPRIIERKFAHSRSLFEDITKDDSVLSGFKSYVLSKVQRQLNNRVNTTKTPEELMSEAGYILYPECTDFADIIQFEKYYAEDEELCTFYGNRLRTCRVWFAVKKDVDDIRREDYTNPERQDRYGTSVISIQFTRDEPISLSIKNRYNHAVKNPDATFSNDLENIIPGLSSAFEKTYGIDFYDIKSEEFYLEGYASDRNGKLYKVNVDTGIDQYCENNVIIDEDGYVTVLDKSRCILMDEFVVDLHLKTLYSCSGAGNCFVESLGQIKDIKLSKDDEGNRVVVVIPTTGEDIKITINKNNAIIGLENNNVTEVDNSFLIYNKSLKSLKMDNLMFVGNNFLKRNLSLKSLSLNKLKICGNNFLLSNKILSELNAESLEEVGRSFLAENLSLTSLKLNKLNTIGNYFVENNRVLEHFEAENLTLIGDCFLENNRSLQTLCLKKVGMVGKKFMANNEILKKLDMPLLVSAPTNFLESNLLLKEINLPSLICTNDEFLANNTELEELTLPSLVSVGESFLLENNKLKRAEFPLLRKIDKYFMMYNDSLIDLNVDSLVEFQDFLQNNTTLKNLTMRKILQDKSALKSFRQDSLIFFLPKNENSEILEYVNNLNRCLKSCNLNEFIK